MTTELTAEETKFFESGGTVAPEPAPEPAPQPAAAPAPVPQTVPLAELLEERKERQRLQREMDEGRKRVEKMEATFQQVLDKANAQPVPKYEEDPLGYLQHNQQELVKSVKGVDEKLSKSEQEMAQQKQMQQLSWQVTNAENEFRGKAQDYDAAVKYLKEVRKQDMLDIGIPAQQVDELLTREIVNLSQASIANGKNPAETAYNMAKRYGFKPAEPQKAKTDLQAIAQGLDASKTVQGGSGGGITLRDLADMDAETLDSIIKDDKKWAALVKGRTLQ